MARRILHIVGAMNPGGIESWLMHVLRRIDRQKFQLDFCTLSGKPGMFDSEIQALGSKVITCRLGRNPLLFSRRFRRILRDGSYDAVHSHVHHFSGAILRWAHAESVSLRIAHSHTTRDGKPTSLWRRLYHQWMKSWILKYATRGLAISQTTLLPLFGPDWASEARFTVLYYGIDLRPYQEPVDKAEVRREFGFALDAPVVGHVGRFVVPKNHEFILRVAKEIQNTRPEVRFLLVGDGPLRPQIEYQAHASGLSDSVRFAGIRRDIPRLMKACLDVLILPSLWEGLGLVLVEAQAAGLPVVSSDVVPRDTQIVPGLVNFMPLSLGPQEWAKKLVSLLEQTPPDRADALRTVAQSQFSIERSVQTLANIYTSSL